VAHSALSSREVHKNLIEPEVLLTLPE